MKLVIVERLEPVLNHMNVTKMEKIREVFIDGVRVPEALEIIVLAGIDGMDVNFGKKLLKQLEV